MITGSGITCTGVTCLRGLISFALVSVVTLSLSACDTTSGIKLDKTVAVPEASAIKVPVAMSSTAAEAKKTSVQMDGDTMYDILAAEFAGNAGDINTSVEFYQKAAAKTGDPRLAARTAYVALYGKDYKQALLAIKRWQKLEPQAAEIDRMYAITYLKLHQPEKALSYIQKTLATPGLKPIDKALGMKALLAKAASPEDALSVLQTLNKQHPDNNQMLILQARYEAQLKHYNQAIKLLDRVYKKDDSLIEILILKARILGAQGKIKAATAQIKQAVRKRPDDHVLRLQYARMLIQQHQLDAARVQYRKLQQKLPDNAEINLSLALIYIDTKKLDKAIAELKHLLEMNKKTSIANYYLGRIAQSKNEKKQAIAYYLHVMDKTYAFDAQLRIAMLLAILHRPNEGLQKLEALAEEQTNWSLRVRIYLAEGEILGSQHRYVEGLKMYSQALKQKPDDADLLYARGLMAEKVDRLDMTEADLRKVISLNPDNANALNALGYTLADRTSRYKEALKYIKRAAVLVPDDPAVLDSLGWVNYRLGKLDDAEKWLSKAFKKLNDPEIAAHYGEVLWVRNKKAQARAIWQKGRKINPDNPVLVKTLKRFKL